MRRELELSVFPSQGHNLDISSYDELVLGQ